jgi:glycosyltransferase involved in cell wall biosynthesis
MIATVMAQTMQDFEIVIVDDGSTEDINSVVQSFNDARIRFFRFDENRGIPHGMNFAFEQASGEYVKPMAADETLWNRALEIQSEYLDKNPGIAACFGLPRHGEQGLRPEYEQYALDAQNRSRAQWLDTLLGLKNVPLGSCAALWRRELFKDLGHFDPALKAFCDHEWYCRLVKEHDIWMLPYRVAEYRDDVSSVGGKTTREEAVQQLQMVHAKHRREHEPKDGLVTVCIPVKDMEKYVVESVKSVVAQTHPNWELIVVDDGSKDKTYEVLRAYLQQCPNARVQVVSFPSNRGQMSATNYALGMARGEYFVPLSADDILEPTHLARVHEVLSLNPLIDFCSTQTDFIGEKGEPFTEAHPFKTIEKAKNKSQDDWKARLRFGNVYFGVGMYRTKALRDVGGWKQEYGVIADYAMYLEMLQRGNIHVIEEPLTHTRITGKNVSTNFDPQTLVKTYGAIRKRFYLPRRKLIIATPFYTVAGFSPYIYALVHTIRAITQAGVDFEYWHPSGDAYVQRVKNTILSKFMEDPEATDLLMIDSDMEWEVEALLKMLVIQEDLIVGSYPQKNSWDMWTSKPKFVVNEAGQMQATQKNFDDGTFLIEGEDLAGGFMLIKRGVLQRYMDAYPDARYVDDSADPSSPNRVYTEFFQAGALADGSGEIKRFWGEDRTFSRRLKAIGERWWIYPHITFGHWGMKGWSGNFGAQLAKMRTPLHTPSNDALAVQKRIGEA